VENGSKKGASILTRKKEIRSTVIHQQDPQNRPASVQSARRCSWDAKALGRERGGFIENAVRRHGQDANTKPPKNHFAGKMLHRKKSQIKIQERLTRDKQFPRNKTKHTSSIFSLNRVLVNLQEITFLSACSEKERVELVYSTKRSPHMPRQPW